MEHKQIHGNWVVSPYAINKIESFESKQLNNTKHERSRKGDIQCSLWPFFTVDSLESSRYLPNTNVIEFFSLGT
jgi:hypothetical protein